MKATPASTLRKTEPTLRIKSPHMGERKTIHVLYIVVQKRPLLEARYCRLMQSVDNPDQALIRPSTGKRIWTEYSPA